MKKKQARDTFFFYTNNKFINQDLQTALEVAA